MIKNHVFPARFNAQFLGKYCIFHHLKNQLKSPQNSIFSIDKTKTPLYTVVIRGFSELMDKEEKTHLRINTGHTIEAFVTTLIIRGNSNLFKRKGNTDVQTNPQT